MINEKSIGSIINDLKSMINSGKTGKIYLKDYLSKEDMGSCMDFAMIYEMSGKLQEFISKERMNGENIQINEDDIAVL